MQQQAGLQDRIGEAEAYLPESCKILPHIHADAPLTDPKHIDLLVQRLQDHLASTPNSKVRQCTLAGITWSTGGRCDSTSQDAG